MRYFAKIDENTDNVKWEFNDYGVCVILSYIPIISPIFIGLHGELFTVLEKIEKNKFRVLFLSESPEGIKKYFNFDEFISNDAIYWAKYIGNKDEMIDKITTSHAAFLWARDIGDKEIMIDKITECADAFYWAETIGNQDVMIDRITESKYAYLWAAEIGDRNIMRNRITQECWISEFEKLK